MTRTILKILRAITIFDGHLVIVGLKGFGIASMTKLANFIANSCPVQLDMHTNFNDDEWKTELQRALMYCSLENRSLSLIIDEYDVKKVDWYKDLECILRNQISSSIIKKPDIMNILV